MASRYYGIGKGQNQTQVVEGSSSNSTAMELVVDLAVFTKRQELEDALANLTNSIRQRLYLPA